MKESLERALLLCIISQGGDLELVTMPGYGMDTYLKLKKLEDRDWMESVDETLDMASSVEAIA